jgi:hypothetical protein
VTIIEPNGYQHLVRLNGDWRKIERALSGPVPVWGRIGGRIYGGSKWTAPEPLRPFYSQHIETSLTTVRLMLLTTSPAFERIELHFGRDKESLTFRLARTGSRGTFQVTRITGTNIKRPSEEFSAYDWGPVRARFGWEADARLFVYVSGEGPAGRS